MGAYVSYVTEPETEAQRSIVDNENVPRSLPAPGDIHPVKRNAFLPDWLDRLIQDDGDVARWYATPLSNIAGHARLRDATPAVPLGGEELAEWSEFLRPHEPGPAIGHQLARLADPRALAVVTGQQAGLFGGPLYTLYKVFGAIHLARRLERELARPVVPLFWVASDDHDFAEVAVHSWLDGEGRLRSWRLPENPAEAGMAIWRRSLTPEMLAPFIEEFAASLPVSGFANDTIEFVRGIAHAPGLSLESQFIRCLLAWTRGTG
ncbi:bacillithiol biosynthesis BshC, partial [Candidatus Poribacteria bacterium]|nr:bacillithiol biosynthesis BshC [Candidatus Poribacteria bacterium]